jgi:hypothetical protein
MDRLLAIPEGHAGCGPDAILTPALVGEVQVPGVSERLRHSLEVRRRNLQQLRQVRQRAHDDLFAALGWVRELVSMLHLVQFTGAPPARAEELLAQIASASGSRPQERV